MFVRNRLPTTAEVRRMVDRAEAGARWRDLPRTVVLEAARRAERAADSKKAASRPPLVPLNEIPF